MTNICLIDDDQNILASLSLTLKSEGYNIKTFSDGLSGANFLTGRGLRYCNFGYQDA
jgi:two-component system response regulator ChvI